MKTSSNNARRCQMNPKTLKNKSDPAKNSLQTEYQIDLNDFVPCKDIPKKFPHLYSDKSWAWVVKQRKKNGLAPAFRRIGKNLFVNLPVFAQCIDSSPAD